MERRAFLAIPLIEEMPPSAIQWTPEDVANYERAMADYATRYVAAVRLDAIQRAKLCAPMFSNG